MNDRQLTEQGLSTEILHDLLSKGMSKKNTAHELGISVHALNRTIRELEESTGVILKYRELQNIQLTSIQAKVLDAITPEKIEAASLSELVQAFRILKDKENCDLGKPTEIRGLVGYLIEMEKQEYCKTVEIESAEVIDEDTEDTEDTDDLPNL